MEVKRELLERAVEGLLELRPKSDPSINDIRAALSAPERKPMTDQDTLDLFNRVQLRMRFTDADARPFASGVASAEFFHGIKEAP